MPQRGDDRNAVDALHLRKVYENEVVALEDLSFVLRRGEILGLVGPNGAGKTTTLLCLLGLIGRTAGEVSIDGYPPESTDARARLGYVPEVPLLYNDLTVEEHLRFVAMAHGLTEGDATVRIESLLEVFDMLPHKDEFPTTFSKGMRQKVSILCSLVHEPDVLLADEPFIGLDPESVWRLKEIFRQSRGRGAAVLLSTHMLDAAETLCDRYLILHRGSQLAEGTLAELRATLPAADDRTQNLEEIFLALTRGWARDASEGHA
ncbi:MAG: ABC transporter ATP-binding protein [Candidatus Bipolaricaulia bacterium]